MSPNEIITINGRRTTLAELLENPGAATHVAIENCPSLAALPDLPAATSVVVVNCPSLAALPDLPAATSVVVVNCPSLAALPSLPAATYVRVYNCPGLTALPALPAATYVGVENCPGLTALPALPAATRVMVYDCPSLAGYAGKDSRGYEFYGVRMRGTLCVVAGCRNLSIRGARKHWGPGGYSDRPDCLALVEKIAALMS